jgi:hypothetical protein
MAVPGVDPAAEHPLSNSKQLTESVDLFRATDPVHLAFHASINYAQKTIWSL